MKTPIIREIAGVHSAVFYDEDKLDEVIEAVKLIITQSVIPAVRKHDTSFLYFFNKNDDILKCLESEPDKLAIDLSIYNDKCKTAYLDFSICSEKNLHKLRTRIDSMMDELDDNGQN